MTTTTGKGSTKTPAIRLREYLDPQLGTRTTDVRLHDQVEVATRDGWLCFWTAGREVRVGPLTPDQAQKLADDLDYDAVARPPPE